MKSTKYIIPWSIPAEFDENETDVRISFIFSPGSHTPNPSHDPSLDDPDVIECVEIIYPDGKRFSDEGPLMDRAEKSCWDHIIDNARQE